MLIDRAGTTARITIEDYGDLLACRGLPEWRMIDRHTAECATAHLDLLGVETSTVDPVTYRPTRALFDYQAWIVQRAVERERFAIFATTGLGKTLMLLDWTRAVTNHHKGRTLIVSPLAVIPQTIAEAARFFPRMTVRDCRDRAALERWLVDGAGVAITNYEKLDDRTEPFPIDAIVLDESSVLKASMGKRRTALIAAAKGIRFKLACSATPAPNDRVEYAEHAFFLDVVRSTNEFLSMFFVNRDEGWELKRHGREAFYRHLASWSVFMVDPRAFRFAGHDTDLPPLDVVYPHVGTTDEQIDRARSWETNEQPSLLGVQVGGVTSRVKMAQIANGFVLVDGKPEWFPAIKPGYVANLANVEHDAEQVIVWVHFDAEGDRLEQLVPGSVHLSGKTNRDKRDAIIEQFRRGEGPRVLILKPSMFGFGLNLQSCRIQIFSTITDSWERWFQAVRRSWRFGQIQPVKIYIPVTPFDQPIVENVMDKQSVYEDDAAAMEAEFVRALRPADSTERRVFVNIPQSEINRKESDTWTMIHADCIAHMPTMPDDFADLTIFSPPFAALFTYSPEAGDMGNVKGEEEFRLQWDFFVDELYRVVKPGRHVVVHCTDVMRFAGQDGVRHTYDFPSDLRAGMEAAGFLYRARIAIDKNPQAVATRTKQVNLLFATLKRNALDSHPMTSECLLMFTKPGRPDKSIHALDVTDREWIEWAHHIWYGINETNTLNTTEGKEHEDERHICPLQLELIERCVRLWTERDELVFSPFAGIGSEGWEALTHGRRFYGIELKRSYFDTACRNLAKREAEIAQTMSLFDAKSVS